MSTQLYHALATHFVNTFILYAIDSELAATISITLSNFAGISKLRQEVKERKGARGRTLHVVEYSFDFTCIGISHRITVIYVVQSFLSEIHEIAAVAYYNLEFGMR